MKFIKRKVVPSASDFGSYVYCGAKLFLDKRPELDSFRKATYGSYDLSIKTHYRRAGQNNEGKCIEWIIKMNKGKQNIIFDGTGKDNQQNLLAHISLDALNISLQCRPDLIIRRTNQIILYEFKAVSDPYYLRLPEYDSAHAQVWCYRFIENLKAEKYYLFRYYIDPFRKGDFPRETDLTEEKLSDEKFFPLFKEYINLIEIFNNESLETNKDFDLDRLNRPVNQPNKCHHCIYYGTYCDPKCRAR